MTQKVCADTIQAFTIAAAFQAPAAGPAPDAQTMIKDIRSALIAKVSEFAQAIKEESDIPARQCLEISYAAAEKDLKKFEKMMKEVPRGFRLVPVLYSKIGDNQKRDAYREFAEKVRYDFMKFLARNYAHELKALGIGPRGLARMQKGGSPVSETGEPLCINVDHIIERGGGGQCTLQRGIDPQLPPGKGKTLLVNHISNFILLPEQIHEFKNTLNKLQNYQDIPPNTSKWILMLIPEAGNGHSGYVAQSQPTGHPLAGLISRERAAVQKIKELDAKIDSLCAFLKTFYKERAVADILSEVQNMDFQQKHPDFHGKKKSFTTLFNCVAEKHPDQMKILNTQLCPMLDEILRDLRDFFQRLERYGKGYKHRAEIEQIYTKYEMNELRRIFAKFPTRKTILFREECKRMDALLKKIANGRPPNRPPLAA